MVHRGGPRGSHCRSALDVFRPLLPCWDGVARHTVRRSRASAVENDHAAEGRQLIEEVCNIGVLPGHLDMAAKPDKEEKVGGSLSEDLVGDVSIPDRDVFGFGTAHETRSLTRYSADCFNPSWGCLRPPRSTVRDCSRDDDDALGAHRLADKPGTPVPWDNAGNMEMRCASCGCLVDRGEVVERCGKPDCCCTNLPDKRP
jgi:hypothetical protein